MRSRHQDDLLNFIEHMVAAAKGAGEKTVILNVGAVHALLELAKNPRKPRGRQPLSGRAKIQRSVAIAAAQSHKKKLIAQGKRKEVAHEEAAEEALNGKLRSYNLSVFTIKRMMEGRSRR